MSRWDAVSWAVILTLTGATPAHPQGLRGTFSARGNVIELREFVGKPGLVVTETVTWRAFCPADTFATFTLGRGAQAPPMFAV